MERGRPDIGLSVKRLPLDGTFTRRMSSNIDVS